MLAGHEAVREAVAAARSVSGHGQAAMSVGRRFRVSNPASRVWWFDRAILDALRGGSSASSPPPRQVVVLGAGSDARPWRLAELPPDTCWFEVDRGEAPSAKLRVLQQLGAALEPGGNASASHPLRVGRWRQAIADLSSPAWADALRAAGFDPHKPTVWVAEGLLMYLRPEAVDALLRRLAGKC